MPKLLAARLVTAILVVSLGLFGCSYSGEQPDPVSRRFTYFSFLAADDIRAACDSGATERYRFVYNAEYTVQVRVYEIAVDPTSGEGRLVTRILGGQRLGPLQFNLDNWLLAQADDRALLRPRDLQLVRETLDEAHFWEPPPHRVALWSDAYYWLVSSCVAGRFHQNGYAYPSHRFAELGFARVLSTYDGSGIPFVEPLPRDASLPEERRVPRKARQAGRIDPFVYYVEP